MSSAGFDPQSGFTPKALTEIQADTQTALSAALGNLDFSPSSVLSQLVGIFASSQADVWAAAAALYTNQFPSGASGVAVDNILAINNLARLPAAATVTDPTPASASNGTVLYGLVFLGDPGTVVPQGSLLTNGAASPATFATDAAVTIQAGSNAQQTLIFSGTPTAGTYALQLVSSAGETLTTVAIPYNAAPQAVVLSGFSGTADFSVTIDGAEAFPLNAGMTAAQMQPFFTGLTALQNVTVTGDRTAGFAISSRHIGTYSDRGRCGAPTSVLLPVQSYVQALANAAGTQPFADTTVSGGQQAMQVNFGALATTGSNLASSLAPIPRIVVASSTLNNGVAVTPQINVIGAPNQGIGTATCNATGATTVLAGQLTTIATPVSGLDSVTNQLDCLTGRAAETDSQALARLKAQAGSSASGSLGSVINRVASVEGVTQVVGFENTTNAAQQVLTFAAAPTSGAYALSLAGETTASLAYNAAASDLQTAIAALSGFSTVQVTATGTLGFTINFVGVRGGQGLGLLQVAQNTTGETLTAYFGRPAHSIEIVAQGGADAAIATAINAAAPAGIATYSSPVLRTTAATTLQSNTIVCALTDGVAVGNAIEAQGVPIGTTVTTVTGTTVVMSAAATQTASGIALAFDTAPVITDAAGNPISVGFSRATSVLVYAQLSLTTDLLNVPAVTTSGSNAAATFNPSCIAAISTELQAIVNSTKIGGTIIANGTGSLGGSFRAQPGILAYSLAFDRVSPPVNTGNLQMAANESPLLESFNLAVSYV